MRRSRVELTRKAPLRARRRTKAERDAWTTLKQIVWIRDRGKCQRCGTRGHDVHHKRLKSQGGLDTLTNCVLLCRECHTDVHDVDRAGAERDGWIIRTTHPEENPDA